MRRWSFGLLLYAVVALAACDDDPPSDADAGDDAGTGGGADNDGGGTQGGDASAPVDTGPLVNDECDPVAQTGCTPPETKCVIEGGNPAIGAECVEPMPNEGALGSPCIAFGCMAGLVCIREVQNATVGVCRQGCNRTTGAGCETLPGEWDCLRSIEMSNWGACSQLPPECNPYTQEPCAPEQACQPFKRGDGSFDLRCRTAGAVGEGMACDVGIKCMRELACIGPPGGATCVRYCQDNTDCTTPLTCTGTVTQVQPAFNYCKM